MPKPPGCRGPGGDRRPGRPTALQPDAQPDQVCRHLVGGAGQAGVGHPTRVFDQALDAPEALGQREDPGPLADAQCGRLPSPKGEAHHASVRPHLPAGRLVAVMAGERRMQHRGHGRVRNAASRPRPERWLQWRSMRMDRVMTPRCTRKQSKGPGTAPAAFWRNPMRSASSESLVATNPPDHVGVPAEVLGGRMDHDVGAEAEGLLEPRGGEGVVHDHEGALAVGDLGHGSRCR